MITFCAWKWGTLFAARHVNILRAALARHVHTDHELVCITDDPTGIDGDIGIVPMPTEFAETPRCRRRMQQYAADFERPIGKRICTIDLDVVIVGDMTAIVSRPEPIVGWKVGHAGVYIGSFLLHDAGALDGAWQRFKADPVGYPQAVQPRGVPSDQAMVNHWLETTGTPVATLTEADGFVSYYGAGYERLEHLGVGPSHPELPAGARIVVLGSADLDALQPGRFPWVDEHWCALDRRAAA
jgi:hypothetical protein